MKSVWSCIRKRWRTVLLLNFLLVVQIFCELALPALTADIIDIGVGQGGISSSLADCISVEGMKKLALLMTKEERETVFAGYAQSGEVYVKKELSAEEEEALLQVITPPMVAVYALSTEGADYGEVLGEDLYVPRDLDTFGILEVLPENTRLELTEAAREKIQEVPQSLITQAAVNFQREDMKSRGVDIDAVQRQYLQSRGLWMLAAVLGMIVSTCMAVFCTVHLAAACAADLRARLFKQVLSCKKEKLEEYSVSDLTFAQTAAVQKIQQFLTAVFRSVLPALFLGAGASILSGRSGAGMGKIVLISFFAGLLCTVLFFLAAEKDFRTVQLRSERLRRTVHELLGGLMVIRAFGTEAREEKRIADENRKWKRAVFRKNRLLSFLMPVFLLILNGAILFLAAGSASGINEGRLQSGELIAQIQYIIMTVSAFLVLSADVSDLSDGVRSLLQVDRLLQLPVSEKKKLEIPAASGENKGEVPAVCFDGVSFQYPQGTALALQDITFSLHPGEVVAIVGETGAGKTTLFRMILDEYQTGLGTVWINGKEVQNYDAKERRETISYIPQNAGLFTGSIADNLRFRKENASEEELWEAITVAQAKDFVKQTEKGLETEIAPGGSNFSGGQRQRLAAARALVGDASVYLIDDCFSALDHETASQLRRALADKIKGSAVLMAVSQLRLIGETDKILVMEHGKIAGIGTHDTLVRDCPCYRRLAFSQGLGEVAKDAY